MMYASNPDDFLYDRKMADQVEREKLNQIREESRNLVQFLSTVQGRCPICTLRPPCKHMAADSKAE